MTPLDGSDHLIVRRPVDDSVAATVQAVHADRVAEIVHDLRHAQPTWEALGPHGRGHLLKRLRDWMGDNRDRLTELVQTETGKPWLEASLEAPLCADFINYYSRTTRRSLAASHPRPHSLLTLGKRLTIDYRPYPVVGVISPWNFPLALAFADFIPALLAGACVVLKPSEHTPLAIREIAKAWREEIDGPAVFAVVPGGPETGAAVVDHVDYVHFTGSTDTGQKVAARAGAVRARCRLQRRSRRPALV